MAVQRVKKGRNRPFVQISNWVAQTDRLSLKAKGLLLYLLSRPDNWQHSEADMVAHCGDGRAAVRAAIAELERSGHLVRVKRREGGKWAAEYNVIEGPSYILLLFEKPRRKIEHGGERERPPDGYTWEQWDALTEAMRGQYQRQIYDAHKQ